MNKFDNIFDIIINYLTLTLLEICVKILIFYIKLSIKGRKSNKNSYAFNYPLLKKYT